MQNTNTLYKILGVVVLVLVLFALYFYLKLVPQNVSSGEGWVIKSEIKNEKVISTNKEELNRFIKSYYKFNQNNNVSITNPTKNYVDILIEKLNIILTDQIQGDAQIYDSEKQDTILADRSSVVNNKKLNIKIYLAPKLLENTNKSNRELTVLILQSLYKTLKPITPDTKIIYRTEMNDIYNTYFVDMKDPIFVTK